MLPVSKLVITYDAECGLCTNAKNWMLEQVPLVRLEFLSVGSAEARSRFPQLPPGELAVVADTGEVWLGDRAWVVCLWALRDYRDLAGRLTSPLLALMARQAFTLVSTNRLALSKLLRLRSQSELERQLRNVSTPQCQTAR